jgi:hypothetical protein
MKNATIGAIGTKEIVRQKDYELRGLIVERLQTPKEVIKVCDSYETGLEIQAMIAEGIIKPHGNVLRLADLEENAILENRTGTFQQRADSKYDCGKVRSKSAKTIATIGQPFSVANVETSDSLEIDLILEYFENYDTSPTMTNEHGEWNPLLRRWRLERADDSPKNQNSFEDFRNLAYVIFRDSIAYGCDDNGKFLRVVEQHSFAGQQSFRNFMLTDTVFGLFGSCMKYAAAHIVRQNAASQDISSTAEGSFENTVCEKSSESRDYDVNDSARHALTTLTPAERKIAGFYLDQIRNIDPTVRQVKHVAKTLNVSNSTVIAAVDSFAKAFNN